jgi:hypothetical protein
MQGLRLLENKILIWDFTHTRSLLPASSKEADNRL